jgi:hypothetical protein
MALIGSTRTLPRDQWGANFREDPDSTGEGVYMRCPYCGRGEPEAPTVRIIGRQRLDAAGYRDTVDCRWLSVACGGWAAGG